METVTTQKSRTVTEPGLWQCRGENIAQPKDQGKAAWSWVGKVGKSAPGREKSMQSHWVGRSQLGSGRAAYMFKLSRAQSTGQHRGRKQDHEGHLLGALNAKPRILGGILRAVRRH